MKEYVRRCRCSCQWYFRGKYTILLSTLLVLPLVQALAEGKLIAELAYWAVLLLVNIVALDTIGRRRHRGVVSLLIVIPSLGGVLSLPFLSSNPVAHIPWCVAFRHGISLVLMSLISARILSDVLRVRHVVFDKVCGALCVYLMIGFIWGLMYTGTERIHPGSFLFDRPRYGLDDEVRQFPLQSLLTYYSFITLTTVGYGDIVPVTSVARGLVWIEAVLGQFYMAVLVARLVSLNLAELTQASSHGSGPQSEETKNSGTEKETGVRIRKDAPQPNPTPHSPELPSVRALTGGSRESWHQR